MSQDLIARLDDKLRGSRETFDAIPVIDVALTCPPVLPRS